KVQQQCLDTDNAAVLSPLDQEEREYSIARWLKQHNAEPAVAEALGETNITSEMLDHLSSMLNGQALEAALRWTATGCATRRLTSEIHEVASRIHDLVAAIKGFTEMDRAAVLEPVDVAQGLATTVTILRAKARGKSVGVSINIEKNLPAVNG